MYNSNNTEVDLFVCQQKPLTPLGLRGTEQKMVPTDAKTSAYNGVPNILNQLMVNGSCIVRVVCKSEDCKYGYGSQWTWEAIGMESSFGWGALQSQPEDNWIQHRKCKLSGGEEFSLAGGLLSHTNEEMSVYLSVCNHMHVRYWKKLY